MSFDPDLGDSLEVATPVSDCFSGSSISSEIIDASDYFEVRDNGIDPPESPYLYHSELDLTSRHDKNELRQVKEKIRRLDPEVVSFHLMSRYPDVETEEGKFKGKGSPLTETQLRKKVRENISEIKSAERSFEVLVENNNHLGTDAYETVTDPVFIDRVVKENDIYFLFDLSHAEITAHNTGTSLQKYISELPLERCRQIHLSRYSVIDGEARDTHDFLLEEDWRNFRDILNSLPNLKFVTVEYYKDDFVLLDQLRVLQNRGSCFIERKDWDSEFFGFEIGSVKVTRLNQERLRYVTSAAEDNDISCLYYTVEEGEMKDTSIVNQSFEKIEERIVYRSSLEDVTFHSESVSRAKESNLDALASIAGREIQNTRFYKDSKFSRDDCERFYRRWLVNAMNGYADEVLAAYVDGEPAGFITCNSKDRLSKIGLVAVSSNHQGRGIGEKLVRAMLNWSKEQGCIKAEVKTQINNRKARNLYRKCGFEKSRTEDVYHWWSDSL